MGHIVIAKNFYRSVKLLSKKRSPLSKLEFDHVYRDNIGIRF